MVRKILVLALVLSFALTAGLVRADSPSGTISVEVKPSYATVADMGRMWVNGVLTFQGKTHTFKLKGLKSARVGVRNLYAKGDVYNLKTASDLAGTYQKAGLHGSTLITGEQGLVIQNDKGVVINLAVLDKRLVGVMRTIGEVFKQEGVQLDLVPEGMIIEQVQ